MVGVERAQARTWSKGEKMVIESHQPMAGPHLGGVLDLYGDTNRFILLIPLLDAGI